MTDQLELIKPICRELATKIYWKKRTHDEAKIASLDEEIQSLRIQATAKIKEVFGKEPSIDLVDFFSEYLPTKYCLKQLVSSL